MSISSEVSSLSLNVALAVSLNSFWFKYLASILKSKANADDKALMLARALVCTESLTNWGWSFNLSVNLLVSNSVSALKKPFLTVASTSYLVAKPSLSTILNVPVWENRLCSLPS